MQAGPERTGLAARPLSNQKVLEVQQNSQGCSLAKHRHRFQSNKTYTYTKKKEPVRGEMDKNCFVATTPVISKYIALSLTFVESLCCTRVNGVGEFGGVSLEGLVPPSSCSSQRSGFIDV